tara:strand:+ start:475 stop:738 length:264 start_codon:yes stop_codon:yes gene_type:complete
MEDTEDKKFSHFASQKLENEDAKRILVTVFRIPVMTFNKSVKEISFSLLSASTKLTITNLPPDAELRTFHIFRTRNHSFLGNVINIF